MRGDEFDVSIVTSGHDVADARLHRETAALSRIGLRVEVLGLGSVADGPADAVVRTWPRAGGLRRAWRAVAIPWVTGGSVVVALDPDSAAGAWWHRTLVGLVPGRKRPIVVADVHEDYELLLRDRAWASGLRGVGGRVWARLGRSAARHADLVVVADHHLMPGIPDRIVLPNMPDRAMLPTPSDREAPPRAVYIGDLRRSRGLFAMLDAVAAAPGWSLDLVGPIAAADRAEADVRLTSPDLAGRVRWHDRRPPKQAWAVASGAWAGLLLLEDTLAFRDSIPSKLYEYLTCGLAVVTTDLPRSAELVTGTRSGAVVADPAEAAAVLRGWSDDVASVDAARAAARAWAEAQHGEPTAEFSQAVRALAPVRRVRPAE